MFSIIYEATRTILDHLDQILYISQIQIHPFFELQGMLILTLTAAISNLHPPSCGTADANACAAPTGWQMTSLLIAFALLVVGASGIRPCNLAFGADQFNPNTESGKRGTTSFFNWYYFTYTFAMMVSLTVIVYVQSNNGWALGLAIPTFLMFLSCAFFFVGTRMYVMVIPTGSPLTSVAQVLVAAIKKRKVELREQPSVSLYNHFPTISINSKLAYTDQFRYQTLQAYINTYKGHGQIFYVLVSICYLRKQNKILVRLQRST